MTSVFAESRKDRYTYYDAELAFDGWLVAGIPGNPKLIEGWLRGQAGVKEEDERRAMMLRTLEEIGGDPGELEDVERASEAVAAETQTCVFKRNGHGLYVEDRIAKAMLKECANIAYAGEKFKVQKKRLVHGPTGKLLKTHFAERVFVEPAEILLDRGEPDGVHLQVGHHMTARGPQSSLGYHEYVERPVLSLTVLVDGDLFPEDVWREVWLTAEQNGLGTLRSQGFGTFEVTKWERRNGH